MTIGCAGSSPAPGTFLENSVQKIYCENSSVGVPSTRDAKVGVASSPPDKPIGGQGVTFQLLFKICSKNNARIAQLVEHDLAKVGVASSSLVSRSKISTSGN